MASVEAELPAETNAIEEPVPEVLSDDESPAGAAPTEDSNTPVTSPRKATVPPKRPLTTAKRPTAPTPSTAAKVTANRTTPGNTLSKPPTRPPVSSTIRRTGTAVAAPGHNPRASVSSIDDVRKGPTSPTAENKRPSVSGAAKRASILPSTASKLTDPKAGTSTARRTTIGSSSTAEKKSATSATKDVLRTTTNNARPPAPSATPRVPRTSTATTRAAPTNVSNEAKKRLSTIPASPVTKMSGVTPTSSPKGTIKPIRPTLGTRKSTMSTTMEQRLREMDLVHSMLKAAMAEDGDEEDEVKEEYGRQMEENLAGLKEKLEEARRNEGKDPIPSRAIQEETDSKEAATGLDHHQVELGAYQEKISLLEQEIAATQDKMRQTSEEAQQNLRDMELAQKGLQQDHISEMKETIAKHERDLDGLRAELSSKIERLDVTHAAEVDSLKTGYLEKIDQLTREHDEELKVVKSEQTTKIETLATEHGDELKDLKATHATRLEELAAERSSQLENSKTEQRVNLDKLAAEHKEEIDSLKSNHVTEVDKVTEKLNGEIKFLKAELTVKDSQHKDLLERSLKDLEAAKLAAAEEGSNEAATLLEKQKQHHEQVMKEIEEKFSLEQSRGLDATGKIESLMSEVTSLKDQLHTQTQTHADYISARKTEIDTVLTRKDEEIKLKEQDLLGAQNELQDLRTKHDQELKELEAAKSRQIGEIEANHESSLKRVSDLETSHASSQKRVFELETDAGALAGQHGEILSARNEEIERLKKDLQNLQEDLKTSHETKMKELESARDDLVQEHTTAINKLQANHDQALRAALEEAETLSTSKVKELQATHDDALNTALEEAKTLSVSTINKMQATHDQALDTALKETKTISASNASLVSEISDLKKENEKTVTEFANSKSEMQSIIDSLRSDQKSIVKARDDLKQELEDAGAQILSLKKILETFDQESQEKEHEHTSAIKKMKDELDRTVEMLEEKTKESTSIADGHAAELETIRSAHAKDIEAREADYQTQRSSITSEHEELLRQTRTAHKGEVSSQREKHEKALADLQEQVITYRNDLANAENELHSSREKENASYREAKDKHSAELEDLKVQLARSESDLAGAREELETADQLKGQIENLKQQHSADMGALQAALTESNATIERLTKVAEDAAKRIDDTSETDRLKAEIADLKDANEVKIAEIKQEMKTEEEKRDKERKTGAEVRDSLAAQLEELEGYRKAYASAKETAEDQTALAQAAQANVEQVTVDLNKALASVREHQSSHSEAAEELATVKAELEQLKKQSRRRSRSASAYKRDLEALQIMSDRERDQNGKLKEQLEETTGTVERHAARVREVEAALKVTNAEITELKTKSGGAKTPPVKSGLGNSKWASEEVQGPTSDSGEVEPEGTDMGSHIEGAMAGLQAQIKLLESINEDMIGDHQRMVNMLSRPTSSGRSRPTSSGRSKLPSTNIVLSPLAPAFSPRASSD